MSEINTGGPAFPSGLIDPSTPQDAVQPIYPGMTLRDYFAAKAMQALVSSPHCPGSFAAEPVTESAYDIADAMLAARSAT